VVRDQVYSMLPKRFCFPCWLTLAGAVLVFAGAADAAENKVAPKVREALDLRYAPGAGDRHELDVFSPAGASRAPVLVLVHGGAWMIGDKDFHGLYRNVGRALARRGLVVVMPNYQLTPRVRHPEHVKDVARAYAWVRRHIKDYGGDPDDIFLAGHSAGGHLVALLATDPGYLKEPALGLTEADRRALRGVIGVSGVYTIPQPDDIARVMAGMLSGLSMGGPQGGAMPAATNSLLRKASAWLNPFVLVFGNDPKQQQLASPLAHVRPGLPPFLLLYAQRDLPLLDGMARTFAAALKKAGDSVQAERIDDRNHDSILFWATDADDSVNRAITHFIEQHRTPPSPQR
jgi:acetyl esterase/lipase